MLAYGKLRSGIDSDNGIILLNIQPVFFFAWLKNVT